MADPEWHPSRYDMRVQPKLLVAGVALALGVAVYALGVADPVSAPAPTTVTVPVPMPTTQPVDRLSSEDIEFLRFLLTVIQERALTRGEQRSVDRISELLEGVENGDVGLEQAPPPPTSPRPTTTTTTTTTTTQPPPTTRPPLIDLGGQLDDLLGLGDP